MAAVTVSVLGVRHHGPGSARSVLAALDELRPRMLLVEAPADATAALAWVGHDDLVPPVALLGHVVDRPRRAVFSPFARFSPEWQAIAWANARGVEVRAIDLPHTITLADDGDVAGAERLFDEPAAGPIDPIAELAAAAGDPDPERWWDDVVEHRGGGLDAFEAVAEAMAAVRHGVVASPSEIRREAHMRRAIRAAIKECAAATDADRDRDDHGAGDRADHDAGDGAGDGAGDVDGPRREAPFVVAVVCGAWHVPALDVASTTAAADASVLRGLPKVKTAVSWVPWTHRRLADAGYGAAIRSPGWYDHVFRHPGPDGVTRFVVDAARELRSAGRSTSPDHLVATSRLADALAALRDRPRPGLDEVIDAADAVMGGVDLVRDRLVIGHAVGAVPEAAPQVPLLRDLTAQQRRLRMRPSDDSREVELDLRTPNGAARSRLLHRLDALGLGWGVLTAGRGSTGTFRETWRLRWDPELSVRAVELAGYGTTVEAAATARLVERAAAPLGLGALANLVDAALLAALPDAVDPVVRRFERRSVDDPDVGELMDALGPLSRSRRYGDVRSTDAALLDRVIDGLVVRILAGLPAACRSLDDDAATVMVERISRVRAALVLLEHPARGGGPVGGLDVRHGVAGVDGSRDLHGVRGLHLLDVLDRLAESPVHGLVRGRCTRLLHDAGADVGPDAGTAPVADGSAVTVAHRLGRALSPGTPAAEGARFVEGFLAGSGTVLLHDDELRRLLDGWMTTLTPESFEAVVPLLRRTFGSFEIAERSQLGRLLAGRPVERAVTYGVGLDPDRVLATVATVRTLLGLPATDRTPS